MLSLSSQPPPNTFRERFQQYRRRHSISQQSPPERHRRRLSTRRSLDLAPHRDKQAHDEPLPQVPQPTVAGNHRVHQKLTRRQSQPARDSRGQSLGPPGPSQSVRGVKQNKQPDHVPPSPVRRRSQSCDYQPKASSAVSQHAGLPVQRRAIPAQCDAVVGDSNIATAFISPGANQGADGREAPFIVSTL